MLDLRRRDFVTLLSGAAVGWPVVARAQQPTPVVGFLSSIAASDRPHHTEAFRAGLDEGGFADGRNVRIEYRFADNRMDQLRPLAEELIARKVDVIAALGGSNTALVVKGMTSTIPILFTTGADPVASGLVASLCERHRGQLVLDRARQQAHRGPQRARPAGRADRDTGQPKQS